MQHQIKRTIIFLTLLFTTCIFAWGQNKTASQNNPAEWSRPFQPFRIAGNLYYVGTYDLACYLITSPKGHILINTGLANSAAGIHSNIKALGFDYKDIKILLTTQAHFDHLGAMAAIKKETGAKMMVDAADAEVMADGGLSDYALGGGSNNYEPIQAERLLHDGDTIKLANMNLVMLNHPGHTKGSCSFLFDVKDKTQNYHVLIANMPSIVTQQKFSEIKAYPDIAADYKKTFQSLKGLSFDIWLSSHASQFGLHKKHKPGDPYNPKAFVDQAGYNQVLADLEDAFQKKLEAEK
jgi:metallo-beta-lactamase class B